MQIGDVWSPNAGISVFNLATSLLPYPTWGVVGLVRVHQRQPFMRNHKPLRGEGGDQNLQAFTIPDPPLLIQRFFFWDRENLGQNGCSHVCSHER